MLSPRVSSEQIRLQVPPFKERNCVVTMKRDKITRNKNGKEQWSFVCWNHTEPTSEPQWHIVKMYASAAKCIWSRCNVDLWNWNLSQQCPLTVNVCTRFLLLYCRDIASYETGINRQQTDRQRTTYRHNAFTVYCWQQRQKKLRSAALM